MRQWRWRRSMYGTMDLHSRKENLVHAHDSARHVAPEPRGAPHHTTLPFLFVHRFGWTACAGHVGHFVALFNPDKTGYAIKTHLFLGQRMENILLKQNYLLTKMTLDKVHFGTVPSTFMMEHTE